MNDNTKHLGNDSRIQHDLNLYKTDWYENSDMPLELMKQEPYWEMLTNNKDAQYLF